MGTVTKINAGVYGKGGGLAPSAIRSFGVSLQSQADSLTRAPTSPPDAFQITALLGSRSGAKVPIGGSRSGRTMARDAARLESESQAPGAGVRRKQK